MTAQAGSRPEVYSLTVESAALTFEAEVPQARGGGDRFGRGYLERRSDAAKEWITLRRRKEARGDDADRPVQTTQHGGTFANVTLTPSVESAGPAIRVTQEAIAAAVADDDLQTATYRRRGSLSTISAENVIQSMSFLSISIGMSGSHTITKKKKIG
ncbi:MAG: hypothetical protein ACLUZZ_03220 [Alistipes inops]